MTQRTKACLTLVACAPILTEIVSGNTPARALLDPRLDLFLLAAYSLPLLVIRELSLRWKLNSTGVLLLGLVYGIWNEGLIAATLLRFRNVPINTFDGYIYQAGFNLSWAALIVPWHALLAVLFPIALVAGFFPTAAGEPWLGGRTFAGLTTLVIALALFLSFVHKPHPQMLVCLAAMVAFTFLAYLLRGRRKDAPEGHFRALPFLTGAVAYPAVILGAIALASRRAPAPIYFVVMFAFYALLTAIARRYRFQSAPAAMRLAAGGYFGGSLFNMAGGILRHSLEQGLTGAILAAIFLCLAFTGDAWEPVPVLRPSGGV